MREVLFPSPRPWPRPDRAGRSRGGSIRLWVAMSWILFGGLGLGVSPDAEPSRGLAGVEVPNPFANLEFRHIGPLGNRVTAVVGVPGEANVYFVGAASGGIFRSTDGGHAWEPIFDDTPASSIGSLAVAPSDPQVIWAGTGETFIRSNVSIGDGIYRSTDGGDTWSHRGLGASGRIGRVVVHPRDPQIVWAAALGHGYGPQPERGIFKTEDGGASWRRVLHAGERSGAVDLVIDPGNPRILFAALWEFEMDGAGRTSGGPGSGIWRSRDGGESWERLAGGGLPRAPWGKIGLGMTAADRNRVYALIETNSNRDFAGGGEDLEYAGTLWRSDDGGSKWEMVNADNTLHQRPLYYTRLLPAPDDADEVHFMAVEHSLSKDGGRSITLLDSGWDHHDIWIDPTDPRRLVVGHDGGVSISTDRGRHWWKPQLPIAQMYRVAVDDEIPYRVYGNRQDGQALRGPSRTLDGEDIPLGAWRSVGGCEVGWSLPDPDDPEVVWSTCYDGILTRYDARREQVRDVSIWPEAIESWPASELRYRFTWSYPILLSRHHPGRIYAGSHLVHSSDDGGQSWRELSPDLTSADPSRMQRTGGLTLDDAGPTIAPSLMALAESPLDGQRLWAGSNDGRLHTSGDGGATWIDLTDRLPDLPPLGTVTSIEPSRHVEGRVYVTIDRHREGDTRPYIFSSDDHGASWRRLTSGIESGVLSYVHCLVEDPAEPRLLFAGTEGGLWWSRDGGESWARAGGGLPPVPVYWIEVQERFRDLVLATYGRGFWILDDVTSLRALADGPVAGPQLVAPRPVYRFRQRPQTMVQPGDPAAGTNPPSGAPLDYLLPEAVDGVSLEILNGEGKIVRRLDGAGGAGLHRVWWDLYEEPSRAPKLRTRPLERPNQALPEAGWRPLQDGGPIRLLARPGGYTFRLKIESGDGEKVLEQPLDVLADPRSSQSAEELEAQYAVLEDLREMSETSARLIDEIEWMRRQLAELGDRLDALEEEDRSAKALEEVDEAPAWPAAGRRAVKSAAVSLEAVLRELEGRFFDLRLTGARQDTLRWRRLLFSRLSYLAGRVGAADAPPTDSQLEVHGLLRHRLGEALARFDEIRGAEFEVLRSALEENGFAGLILGTAKTDSSEEKSLGDGT